MLFFFRQKKQHEAEVKALKKKIDINMKAAEELPRRTRHELEKDELVILIRKGLGRDV